MSKHGYERNDSKHYYEIVDLGWGFRVEPQSDTHENVWVWMDPHGFWQIQRESKLHPVMRKVDPWRNDSPEELCVDKPWEYNMYNLPAVIQRVVEVLYMDWRPKEINGRMYTHFAPEWMVRRTRKCLSKPIKRIWKRIILQFDDPLAVKLHKKFHSVRGGMGATGVLRALIRDKEKHVYTIKDALNLYAARATLFLIGAEVALDMGWMKYWCADGELSKSMRKTLSQYTGYGLGWQFMLPLMDLRDYITEPITSRLKLLALWAIARNQHGRDTKVALMNVLNRSTDAEMKRAVEIAHEQRRQAFDDDSIYHKLDFRRTKYIQTTFSWIFDVAREMDADQVSERKITGLAKESVDYHRNLERYRREQRLEWERRNAKLLASKTALPPIDLPDEKGVRFLDTYKSIREEGEFMGHCVGGYASSAVNGQGFFFHIEIDNSHATAQVTRDGNLYQVHGPGNRHSKAVDYGKKVLLDWVKDFPSIPAHIDPDTDEYIEIDVDQYEMAIPF